MRLRLVGVALAALLLVGVAAADSITIAPGGSPAGGYLPLSLFGIPAMSIGDDAFQNFNVSSFSYAGQSWNSVGVASNGYIVVGGASSSLYAPIALPSNSAPGNILAPFWTDLDPSAGGGVRIGELTDGSDNWIVVDWEAVPLFTDHSNLNSFQIWIGIDGDAHPGEDITFAYGLVGTGGPAGLGVAAQDITRTIGDTYYFNGTGTLPVNGTQLRVTTDVHPVPEPASLSLLGLGLAGLGRKAWKRFRA